MPIGMPVRYTEVKAQACKGNAWAHAFVEVGGTSTASPDFYFYCNYSSVHSCQPLTWVPGGGGALLRTGAT